MNRCILALSAALVALTWTGLASAQTTKPADLPSSSPSSSSAAAAAPAPVTWTATVEQLARATEAGDVPLIVATLARDAQVRSFESHEPAAARTLVDAAAGWQLLGAHGYEFPPPSLAGDISADVKNSTIVPDADKRKITPLDDGELARANTTAGDWVAQTLGAERNHLVGVAVFWNVKTNRPMFVLVKGEPIGRAYAVKLAVYGDPMVRRPTASAR